MEYLLSISLLLLLVMVSIWDVRTKRIPNAFIFIGLLTGVTTSFLVAGWSGLGESIVSIVLAVVVFIWFWGFVAAGDIKLMFVVASFIGVGMAFKVLLLSFLIASVILAVFNRKETVESMKKVKYFLFYKVPMQALSKSKAQAFSPYILLSYIIVVFV
jgi:Flp pilus assembly protein protease CpaA